MIQEQFIEQEQATQAERVSPLSFLIREKDKFFWETEVLTAYAQKIGKEELASALAKFDKETEGETCKVGKAKRRLIAWLDDWQDKLENPTTKPQANGSRKPATKFNTAKWYTNLFYPDKEGENEMHEAFTESFRTPYGHRIIIDIPDIPFKHIAAMIAWDKKDGSYYVFDIKADHDLSEQPYLNCCFQGDDEES